MPAPAMFQPPAPLDLSRVPPEERAAALEYDAFLGRLTFNSKDVINSLTRIAAENEASARGITEAIVQRAMLAPPHAKLPFLYLTDSIVKNIGRVYIEHFARSLFHSFSSTYAVVSNQVRMSMHRLLNTWPPIFGMDLVTAMRRAATDIDAAPPQQVILAAGGVPAPVGRLGPAFRSAPQPPAAPPHHQDRERQIQSLMADINSNVAMRRSQNLLQLRSVTNLINLQLQAGPPPAQRDRLLAMQQQVASLSPSGMPPPVPLPRGAPLPHGTAPLNSGNNMIPLSSPYPSVVANPRNPVAPPMLPPGVDPSALSDLMRAFPPQTNGMMRPVGLASAPRAAPLAIPRRRPAPMYAAPPPPALKFSDLKNISHASAVRALYTELPHLSKSDGMRFASKDALRKHLDWLFAQNRRKRARDLRNLGAGGISRCWYEPTDVFLRKISNSAPDGAGLPNSASAGAGGPPRAGINAAGTGRGQGGGSDGDNSAAVGGTDAPTGAIEAKGENETCPACCESFESFWDDDKQAWMLKEATRMDDGMVFHPRCVVLDEASPVKDNESEHDHGNTPLQAKDTGPPSPLANFKKDALLKDEPMGGDAVVKSESVPDEGSLEPAVKRRKTEPMDSDRMTHAIKTDQKETDTPVAAV